MNAQIYSFPSNHNTLVAEKLAHLASGIKRDVGRYTQLRGQPEQNEKVEALTTRCRLRIFDRLKEVATIQEQYNISPECWRAILHQALTLVHKHSDSVELQDKVNELFRTYRNDVTQTKVEFVRAYMEIVAQIKPHKISSLFHG